MVVCIMWKIWTVNSDAHGPTDLQIHTKGSNSPWPRRFVEALPVPLHNVSRDVTLEAVPRGNKLEEPVCRHLVDVEEQIFPRMVALPVLAKFFHSFIEVERGSYDVHLQEGNKRWSL